MEDFLHIGFTHHRLILGKVKNFEERLFYIKRCANEHYTVDALKESLVADDYHHQSRLPNNFMRTISVGEQALKAVSSFKDKYLLEVATYKTSKDMSEELKKALPDVEDLRKLLDVEDDMRV